MQEDIKRNDYYIYNLAQVNWMLKKGCQPIEAGKGCKNGDLYLKFPRTEYIEEKVNEWKLGLAMLDK